MYVYREDGLFVLYGDQAARVEDPEARAKHAVDAVLRFIQESRADESAPWQMGEGR